MPLLDGRNEPFGRVDLVLHELNRLLVLLADRAVGADHLADHVHIAAVHADFGNVVRIERELEPPVLIIEDKIGNDIGRRVGAALGIEVAGLGREPPDLGDRFAEILLRHLQARHQFLVMLLDELFEIVGQNLAGQPPGAAVDRNLRHLQQQALPQVAGADTGRLQFVQDSEQALQLLGRSLDSEREGDVVGNGFQIAAQVTVLVDAPDQIGGQTHVTLRKVAETELFEQIFGQRTAFGQENRTLFVVFRIVVYAAFIGRRIVFAQILVHGDLLRLLLLFGRMFLFLQHDVVLNLLFDTLFELHGGQLQELDHLNLLRRELLLKR